MTPLGPRRVADLAATRFGVSPVRVTPLANDENLVYGIRDRAGDRYVLRIHRIAGTPVHPVRHAAEVRSELTWLVALRREKGLSVPEPVRTDDGAPFAIVEGEDSLPRICVLFRWLPGRFLDAALRPTHLERVGRLMGSLHDHSARFASPPGFVRWRIADWTPDTTDWIRRRVRDGWPAYLGPVDAHLREIDRARHALGTASDAFGLIHGDLHQENYLFRADTMAAIDFDDCGWGHYAYDLAVTLSELRGRTDYPELRRALLRGYRDIRPLPAAHEHWIGVFRGTRSLLLALWLLERRGHPGFDAWEFHANEAMAEIAAPAGGRSTRS